MCVCVGGNDVCDNPVGDMMCDTDVCDDVCDDVCVADNPSPVLEVHWPNEPTAPPRHPIMVK